EVLEKFLPYLTPGGDSFPEEKEADELAARLAELGARLRKDPRRAADVSLFLLAPTFRGGRLRPASEVAVDRHPSLQIFRAGAMAPDLVLDPRSFAEELGKLVEGFREVTVAEFLITAIEVDREKGLATTDVRYDIVGPGTDAWRAERSGTWRMRWRRGADGWRVMEWTATTDLRSRASGPVFAEITTAALGGNDSFRRQLSTSLDAWVATIDSPLTRDSNGHHGVSVGDADGDGLEDLYVAQPSGLPNRLYRARGDGTFEDATEKAGLGILDDTAQSLFADVDNDGDQDLIVGLSTGPALFLNDGTGRFTRVPDAFRFEKGLQGSPMSMAMADYDRDGFLDLYLCVYSFYYGAGEDKAGTPMPYYDARNGPPSVLFRNDGHGHFVETTHEAGLDQGNDRYHFAAAWADYDGDGWPDLLVANDFGRKNLYHNRGMRDGKVTFEDVAAPAGVEDYGAGMSATWLDYDNDGRLDIYTGNIWSDNGQRVTAQAAFMPDAPAEVRALYRRHARGNSLFRNRGDGGFEDVSEKARAEMGRWAWSSDALDFDSDGWEDLYVANGMLTRASGPQDLDGFFWRQVVARSPLTRVPGTPYDDAWRAINQALIHQSMASHQRNVLLRNDGQGGFDDVSGTVGLDLDQDGRSFAVLDQDGDGDPDVVVMAARSVPQLRVFRNDFKERGAALAVRLAGRPSNRDAVGARVTVETDQLRRVKVVQAGSGFLSQHSKELLFGLGASQRVIALTVEWPSGRKQVFADVPLNHRLHIEEGGQPRAEPFRTTPALPVDNAPVPPSGPSSGSWLYEPFPAPDFSLPDLSGESRSLSALRGRPAIALLWDTAVTASRTALQSLARGTEALARAGVGVVAVAVDPPADLPKVRAAAAGATTVPVVLASEEVGRSYAILYRHLFMNQQDLPLPTAFLLDAEGRVVKVYRDRVDVAEILRDVPTIEAPPAERLARALPFAGTFLSPLGVRNYLPYGRELLDQGLDAAAVVAFERAAQGSPSASTLYRLGTLLVKSGETTKARAAFERALAMQPDLSEASNDLGALLAQDGDLPAAIEKFRAALATTPDYPDALNNLGYALLLTGHAEEARDLYQKALKLQPDFPEALNNLGLILGREGQMERAEHYFREALAKRGDYGEAANNLALVLVARGQQDDAIRLLEGFLETRPGFENTYLTLAKIYLAAGRQREGLQVIERLLQRNPTHPLALEIARQVKSR
ncbi:MAG TPA: FG-GAP-like repeat-containing protein, partial [Vicinamibacteria bacterium]|nr:FG-GAP-like repeat-containing protein [Vicinamibacteria bacterium]